MTADPSPTPFPVSYWVRPGELLAGEYPINLPGSGQSVLAERSLGGRQRIERLLSAGVTAIIDLTEEGEQPPYLTLLREVAAQKGVEVAHTRRPLTDWAKPDPAAISGTLDLLDDLLAEGHTVYVHCKAGIGRTGTVIATHLVRRGLTGEQALAEMTRLRADVPDDRLSPLMEGQRELVCRWGEVEEEKP
jgi:protein-tyrosine phosphatase